MIAFRLEGWRAWSPGLESAEDWLAWAKSPRDMPDDAQAQPSCAFVPALPRRRLSRLARMTLETAWPLCGDGEQLPFVFGSRHGETPQTLALLTDIADRQPLSPTRFGLSVHNAIAGQWSILRGQRGESSAIAGEADTFEHAVLEGALQLAAGAPAALVVVAEELPPPTYAPWIADVPFSYAVALRLGKLDANTETSMGDNWQLRLDRAQGDAPCTLPHALDFLRALLVRETAFQHAWKTRRWNWRRIP